MFPNFYTVENLEGIQPLILILSMIIYNLYICLVIRFILINYVFLLIYLFTFKNVEIAFMIYTLTLGVICCPTTLLFKSSLYMFESLYISRNVGQYVPLFVAFAEG